MTPPEDRRELPPPNGPETCGPPPVDPFHHPPFAEEPRPRARGVVPQGEPFYPPVPERPAPGLFASGWSEGPGGPEPHGPPAAPILPPDYEPQGSEAEAPFERDDAWPPTWLTVGMVAILPVLLVAVYYRQLFMGLTHGDALDFAQLGRNVMEGRGFVTYILRPLVLSGGGDPFQQPEVTHGPFYPFLLAAWFGALSARDSSVAALSALFYVLTVPVIYLLGARTFNRGVGVVSAVIFATNKQVLEYAISGLHLTLCLFLTTLLFLVLYQALQTPAPPGPGSESDAPPPHRKLLLAGLLTGLLVLTEPLLLWFLPALIWVLQAARPEHRLQFNIQFLAGAGMLILPWMVRNFDLSGDPCFGMRGLEFWMAGDQTLAVGYRMERAHFLTGFSQLPAVLHKAGLSLDQVLAALPTLSGVWLVGAVLPSLFVPPPPAAARLRGLVLACYFLLLVGSLFQRIDMPLFVLLVPVLTVFAVAYYQYLFLTSTQRPLAQVLVTAVLLGMLIYPTVGALTVRPKPATLREAAIAQALKHTVGAKDVVLSDQPWIVAWHADRPALWIPASEQQLPGLRKTFPTTRWLFLTAQGRAFSTGWATLYDVFIGWRHSARAARQAGKPSPQPIGIRQGDPDPLFSRLGGLTAVDIDEPGTPTTVVAGFPGSRAGLLK